MCAFVFFSFFLLPAASSSLSVRIFISFRAQPINIINLVFFLVSTFVPGGPVAVCVCVLLAQRQFHSGPSLSLLHTIFYLSGNVIAMCICEWIFSFPWPTGARSIEHGQGHMVRGIDVEKETKIKHKRRIADQMNSSNPIN